MTETRPLKHREEGETHQGAAAGRREGGVAGPLRFPGGTRCRTVRGPGPRGVTPLDWSAMTDTYWRAACRAVFSGTEKEALIDMQAKDPAQRSHHVLARLRDLAPCWRPSGLGTVRTSPSGTTRVSCINQVREGGTAARRQLPRLAFVVSDLLESAPAPGRSPRLLKGRGRPRGCVTVGASVLGRTHGHGFGFGAWRAYAAAWTARSTAVRVVCPDT